MKICIDRATLINALDITSKAVTQKSPVPMLEGIHINAVEGSVKFRGFCVEMTIETTVKCDVMECGAVVANARLLCEAIRKMPERDVFIAADGKAMIIESGIANIKISVLAAESYPAMPTVDTYKSFEISTQVFRELTESVIFAAVPANEVKAGRQTMKNICFDIVDFQINAVGTDAYRMAIASRPIDSQNKKALIPARQLESVLKYLRGNILNISMDEKVVLIKDGFSTILINRIDGEFIAYQNMMPKGFLVRARVHTNNMRSTLERALLFLDIEANTRLIISISNDKMNISLKGQQGEIDELVPAKIEGDTLKIGFNPRYLMEAFKNINDEEVYINFTSEVGPATVTPIEGNDFFHLVLPVRPK